MLLKALESLCERCDSRAASSGERASNIGAGSCTALAKDVVVGEALGAAMVDGDAEIVGLIVAHEGPAAKSDKSVQDTSIATD